MLAYATMSEGGGTYGGGGARRERAFTANAGLMAPGQIFAVLAQRHMHLYGTTREHFAEVAISTRANAIRRPTSLHEAAAHARASTSTARMISDPLCLFDFCMECDGAVAVITTSAERARDLRQPPVYILASAHGGNGRWGQAIFRGCGCPTTTSRRRGTARSRSGCTRWPASRPPTSTSRCSTTTSRRW